MKNNPDIIWLDVAESSNDEARKAIDSLDNLSVVAVRCQTAGRGQGTNTWLTAPGENLTFSIILKDLDILPNQQIAISQITALSVAKFLELHGIDAKIKRPNDIYVGSRKICGILIENTLCAGKIKWSIAGIGINVNQTAFPSSLPNPTSILLEKGYAPSKTGLLNSVPNLCQNPETNLDLQLLLRQFHDIYSEFYHNHLSCPNSQHLKSLDQIFQSKLLS